MPPTSRDLAGSINSSAHPHWRIDSGHCKKASCCARSALHQQRSAVKGLQGSRTSIDEAAGQLEHIPHIDPGPQRGLQCDESGACPLPCSRRAGLLVSLVMWGVGYEHNQLLRFHFSDYWVLHMFATLVFGCTATSAATLAQKKTHYRCVRGQGCSPQVVLKLLLKGNRF